MEQNIIVVKRQEKLSRDKYGRAVIKIDKEAADVIESFINKSSISITQLASSMITYAAPYTMIKEGDYNE